MGRWDQVATLLLSWIAGIAARDPAHDRTTITLWPTRADGALQVVQSTEGGKLVASKDNSVLETTVGAFSLPDSALPDGVDSIELAWVAPSNLSSSTFRDLLSPRWEHLPFDSVGLHMSIEVAAWSLGTSTAALESAVRTFLERALPHGQRLAVLPLFHKGFLALSRCYAHGWHNGDKKASSGAAERPVCFSASFPYARRIAADQSESLTALERHLTSKPEIQHRLRVCSFTQSTKPSARVSVVDVVEVAAKTRSNSQFLYPMPQAEALSTVAIVSSAKEKENELLVEYSAFQHNDNGWESTVSTAKYAIKRRRPHTITGVVNLDAHVEGNGFHQRVVVDAVFDGTPRSGVQFLLHVPLSNAVYVDLDEMRRLERFGKFELISATKHIEIERPSTVSPQHTIALAISADQLQDGQLEFPIHFRYQEPSIGDRYRQALVISPELFVLDDENCQVPNDRPHHNDNNDRDWNSEWALEFQLQSFAGSCWRRVHLRTPLHIKAIDVPVGFLPDGRVVSALTLSVTAIGAIILMSVALSSSKKKVHGTSWTCDRHTS
ncbi:TPA: hypothetical protein N0F65_004470 [Lagenidium giganteum]|uniref:Protein PBN1 n=1 Tax=Lagenidium giganteum TaxID=4803 RepID=A0AAV2ZJR0_9STRA|nr:TPA: hypothetical protein N0F65_004470 [Lagenidium giganteum]